ncbi:MAG: hypothetical protein R3325_07910, partial [Thermoanaerobaculia bacterium]|nr:hypothetical protein [Thermoanaerobaculia bacterium]
MRFRVVLCALLLLAGSGAGPSAALPTTPETWTTQWRVFVDDGPALLLERAQRDVLAEMDAEGRRLFLAELLSDPLPETPENELVEGLARRQALVRRQFLSYADDRARLLFLHGAPSAREPVDCGQTFVPLEIWSYPARAGRPSEVVLYRPTPADPYRLWLPLDGKRALYTEDMVYWLQQWEELKAGRRFDLQICPSAKRVDAVTGVDGLRGFREGRPGNNELLAILRPPDRGEWAREAAATPLPELPPPLPTGELKLLFPDRIRQRIVARFQLTLPPDAGLAAVEGAERREVRLNLQGVVEQDGKLFEEFRVRYELEPPDEGEWLALVFERALRPQRDFVVRFRLTDEGSGAEAILDRAFRVPAEAEPVEEPPLPEEVIVAMGEELSLAPLPGRDSLLLAPPSEDVVLGVWRAEALVTGEGIVKVVFLLDGQPQLTRTSRPFSAELRLAQFPREQVVRAEGYDAQGDLVASDEVVLNRPRGAFRVRIESPRAGARVGGTVEALAEVSVPEGRAVREVEFRLNEETIAVLSKPPWQTRVEVPPGGEVAFLTVLATLDDGQTKEEVRYLNSPQFLEEVEVQLVELLTTVTDSSR